MDACARSGARAATAPERREEIHSYLDESERGLLVGQTNPAALQSPTSEAMAIMLGGGRDAQLAASLLQHLVEVAQLSCAAEVAALARAEVDDDKPRRRVEARVVRVAGDARVAPREQLLQRVRPKDRDVLISCNM